MSRVLCLAAMISVGAPFAHAQRNTAKWLVDLGRDYPLTRQAAQTQADAELTLAFMQAATRIDPDMAEGYLWQHDLLAAMPGREEQANAALESYIKHRPDDVPAQLWSISLAVEKYQTAEQRADFCRSVLDGKSVPPAVASDLDRRLGMFHYNRGEMDKARERFQSALSAYPGNLIARESLIALDESQPESVRRARYLLAVMRVSPGRAEAAQELGDTLVSLGLYLPAAEWFGHAARLYREADPGSSLIPALLTARARALIDGDRLDEAEQLLDTLLKDYPDVIDARVARARLAEKRGNTDVRKRYLDEASALWKRLGGGDVQLTPDLNAAMAWFYVHDMPQELGSVAKLADAVLTANKDNVVARRALGTAQRLTGQPDKAAETLAPIADTDGWAALERARALHDAGKTDQAVEQLRKAMALPLDGEQRDVASALTDQWQVDVSATRPSLGDLPDRLASFPRDVLDYPFDPSKYLEFTTAMSKDAFQPGEPWWCTLTLKNVGTFPIYLGPDLMIAPDVICHVAVLRPGGRSLCGEDIRMSLRGKLFLAPGESIDMRQTLDIGSVRAMSIAAPQLELQVQLTAMVDPLEAEDNQGNPVWIADVRSVSAAPTTFKRIRFPANQANLKALAAQSVSSDVNRRIAATQLLAMLLAEQQHVAAGRLTHAIETIDQQMLGSLLLKRATDPEWKVRARLAEAMRWFVLDKSANAVLTRLLSDDHWLVRGLALRAMADHFGHRSEKVRDKILAPYAKSDLDAWVRQVAGALRERAERRKYTAAAPPKQPDSP